MAAGTRSRGRAYALQILYARDLNPAPAPDYAVDSYSEFFALEMDRDAVDFARALVATAVERMAEIDDVIQGVSRNWRLERMSKVDRNILRLGTSELRFSPEVPEKVVINEAVELAKRFGTEESAAFVNGILDRLAHQLRSEKG